MISESLAFRRGEYIKSVPVKISKDVLNIELVPGESVLSHANMLKATFSFAFPMEASMSQILEEAMIYKVCKDKESDRALQTERDELDQKKSALISQDDKMYKAIEILLGMTIAHYG